jgi:hypothetical protein
VHSHGTLLTHPSWQGDTHKKPHSHQKAAFLNRVPSHGWLGAGWGWGESWPGPPAAGARSAICQHVLQPHELGPDACRKRALGEQKTCTRGGWPCLCPLRTQNLELQRMRSVVAATSAAPEATLLSRKARGRSGETCGGCDRGGGAGAALNFHGDRVNFRDPVQKSAPQHCALNAHAPPDAPHTNIRSYSTRYIRCGAGCQPRRAL